MYRKVDAAPTPPSQFELPFEEKLSQDNRWIIMANLIPWDEFEQEYAQDLGLLNQARVKTEKIIDTLYEELKEKLEKKLKTYRNLARKN